MTSDGSENALSVVVVVLAAGRSSRMDDGGNKLVAVFDGRSLIRRSVSTALSSRGQGVVVVTGHRYQEVFTEIVDLPCQIVHNPDHMSGMASSIGAGVAAAAKGDPDGIMVALADMPHLAAEHFNALIGAFAKSGGNAIVRANGNGYPGNPVIFPRILYDELQRLTGDAGARSLINNASTPVIDVEIGKAALVDVDTLEQILSEGGSI